MTHYSEQTLELLVLDSPKVKDQREEILAHLSECKGCAELYGEIREFYGAMTGPEALPEHTEGVGSSLQLSPSYGTSVVQRWTEDRPAVFAWARRNRQAVSTAGSLAVAATVAMFFALRFGSGVPLAHHAVFDDATQSVLIADRTGSILFSIPVPQLYAPSSFRLVGGMPTVLVEDLDGDRIAEVITWLPVQAEGSVDLHLLRVFRSDGSLLWKFSAGEELSYGDRYFSNQFNLKGVRTIQVQGTEGKDLIVAAAHSHSPFIFYRLSPRGEVIGQYRMMGHATSFTSKDTDGDGTSEVFFAGTIDSGSFERTLHVGGLNPALIVGTTEATFVPNPGFGVPASRAELAVVRIPPSPINDHLDKVYSNISGLSFRSDGNMTADVSSRLLVSGTQVIWEYTFTADLVPLQVNATDAARSAYEDLRRRNVFMGALTSETTDAMLRGITYWDGTTWRTEGRRSAGMSRGSGTEMFDPVSATPATSGLSLLNHSGRVVGTVALTPEESALYTGWSKTPKGISTKVIFTDADGDGLNEVLLYRLAKEGGNTLYALECRSPDGSGLLWSRPFKWDIDFPGKPDDIVPYYTAGDMYPEDVDNDGAKDLIVVAGNLSMFPCLVLRIDPGTGDVQNTYLHIGHLQAYGIIDLDGDGRKEILLGGVANSYKEAALVVLDASDFSGVSPHSEDYRPVGWSPGNERAYFRIPQTIVGEQFWRTTPNIGFQQLDIVPPSRHMHAWVIDFLTIATKDEEAKGSFAVHISYDLKVKGVSTGSLFDAAAERLYREGKLSRRIDTS